MRLPSFAFGLGLILPVGTLVFLVTAPHGALALLGVAVVALVLARFDGVRPTPAASAPAARARWPLDALLTAIAIAHLVDLALLVRLVRSAGSLDALTAIALVGATTAYSAGIVAHELVHRRGLVSRTLGRALLATALYEHFYVEHLRGHHARVATEADPTTARFGETFVAYAIRSVPGQLVAAWRLDRAAVAVGVAVEVIGFGSIGAAFGPSALVAMLGQALVSTALITAVNYFDHWGLRRAGRKVTEADAWDCDSRFSQAFLLALSRHADHHVHAARRFEDLGATDGSPKLPHGYLRMVFLVVFRNAHARRLMTAELERKGLGPFATA
jgi:alkane 1-monooxygenase